MKVEKVLTARCERTGSAVVSARRSVEGYDIRRLHAMALLLLAGQAVEGNQRHTTEAFISTASSQGKKDELWMSGRSSARDRWR
jgi:hypothetical protein